MNRRSFLNKTATAGILPLMPMVSFSQERKGLIKPRALPDGGAVSLITPASPVSRTAFEKALQNISDLGFSVRYSPNVRVRSGFLSGTDEQRIQDLHAAFEDSGVDAILCLRGGYGSGRLLPSLSYDLIRNNPKPLIGFSDVTALLAAIYKKCGMVCFHGPVATSEFNEFTAEHFCDLIQKGKRTKIKNDESKALVPGVVSAPLIGGNLSILCSLIGTPYDVDYSGHILLLEEVGEATYRIDRMLTQLLNAGKLQYVKGIALGHFTGCDTKADDPTFEYSLSLDEVFMDRLGCLGIPISKGFPFGHEAQNAAFPIGIEAELDAESGSIKLLESAVS